MVGNMGLKLNIKKTKLTTGTEIPLWIPNEDAEMKDSFIFFEDYEF